MLKNMEIISFDWWKIQVDSRLDFGASLNGATFRKLGFNNCGKKEYSDFENHPNRLKRIMKALGEVDSVKTHLEELWLYQSGVTEKLKLQDWKKIYTKPKKKSIVENAS